MKHYALAAAAVAAVMAAAGRPAQAEPCNLAACARYFPSDAGAINVRDFGARGDGKTDDTAAIIKAIDASGGDTGRDIWHDRLIFLPAGTYVVSDTLSKHYANGLFASGMALIGAGASRTTIRLADYAPGFDDAGKPRGIIMTTSKKLDAANNRDYIHLGEGNDAYENFVESLTIDAGHGNPGAIGLDYLGNNIGAVRDVLIRAPAGSGATGLSMTRKFVGPALIQRVGIEGFGSGIDMAGSEYGITFSQVDLHGQTRIGFHNAGNSVAADTVTVSETGVPAIVNAAPTGLMVFANSRFDAPVENAGTLVFRSVSTPPGLVSAKSTIASGWLQGRDEWHAGAMPWSLPLPSAPTVDDGPVGRWVGVSGEPDDAPPLDATARLQAAVNSGASTVYLRHGTFRISAPIVIPPSLHHLIGMNSTITLVPRRPQQFRNDNGFFQITQPGAPLLVDHLAMDMTNRGKQVGVELAAARPLILRDVIGAGITTLDRKPGGGEAFLDDIAGGILRLAGPAEIVARQLNTEGSGTRVVNQGAPLAVVGVKTEQDCTVVESLGGARTEILGGLIYEVVPNPDPNIPAFITENASIEASFVEEAGRPGDVYTTYLTDRQGAQMRLIGADTMPKRGFGRLVPLLSAGPTPGAG